MLPAALDARRYRMTQVYEHQREMGNHVRDAAGSKLSTRDENSARIFFTNDTRAGEKQLVGALGFLALVSWRHEAPGTWCP